MKRSSRTGLFAFGLALLAGIVMLQSDIDPKRDRIQQPLHGREQTELIFQLPGPYILATFTGMRESVAGLLWVRADEFFHQGNYEAIMPLIRLITWLDPHYMDVYKVGAWHLDFNITDKDERSDRRYIPPALALLREGIKNNPDTYDLPFDLAFVHYNLKMRDYENAVKWMKVATDLPDLNPETDDSHQRYPLVVDRMLAHMYEKTGDIESSKKIWKAALAETKRLYKKYPQDGILGRDIDVCMRNYNLMLWRQEHRKWDIRPIVDMKFEANWVRKKPRFIYISGKINLMSQEDYLKMNPLASEEERKSSLKTRLETIKNNEGLDGSRIDIVLSDIDYNPQDLNEFSWDIPKNVTIMIDGCRVHNGMFEAEIDMSKDPHIYAFKKKKYRLTLSFDPRTAPDFIQDRIGWHGEGLTDKKYLDTKTIPGTRMIRKEWVIDREDLM